MHNWIIILFAILTIPVFGQEKPYFQQEVNYHISATLDDVQHQLSGEVNLTYINHSPDTLLFLYFHLWTNAYRDRTTAFSRQKIRNRSSQFYFAKGSNLGYYGTIDFCAHNETLSWSLDPENPDIARVDLPQPLAPGARIELNIPFVQKVPAPFSRMGHYGQAYQFSQWYPKPAVYDREGWHPMPYLDMGEFYSEFGSFDVELTLPANYVVAATGELQTESERRFLEEKAVTSASWLEKNPPVREDRKIVVRKDTFPVSRPEMKTIRYTAERVHDFAWFADKRFFVLKGEVPLASGRKVDTWAFFTRDEAWLWKDAITYINRCVGFYSGIVGEYPYPHATAVMSSLGAGGGMEYPMITVIGTSGNAKALDMVITHEVGHNWFYGILASNERDHPWIDEGINTYYENRYRETYYGKERLEDVVPLFLVKGIDASPVEMAYLLQARRHKDQAPETSSDDFKDVNYWLSTYAKTGWAFRHLEGYLGRESFDRAMQALYREWQFRHPGPADLRETLERETGKSLGWLFDGYLFSNEKMDYAIQGLQKSGGEWEVKVKNRKAMAPPFSLSGMKDSTTVEERWYEGLAGSRTIAFPAGDYDRLVLDHDRYLLDYQRGNNQIRTSGPFPKWRIPAFRLFTGVDCVRRSNIYAMPLLTFDNYDKLQAGIGLHNISPIQKSVEWYALPVYSFVAEKINGLAGIRANIYPGLRLLPEWTLGLDAKRFSANYNWSHKYYLDFYRISPSLRIRLAAAPNGNMEHFLRYRLLFIGEERALFADTTGLFLGTEYDNRVAHIWSYELDNRQVVNPHSLRLALEQQSYEHPLFPGEQHYLRLSLDARGKYTYDNRRHLYGRLFAGYHLINTIREAGAIGPGAFNLTAQGFGGNDDYNFEELYFGRNESRGVFANQISMRDAGFKNAFPAAFQGRSGNTNDFMIALNLKADLPKDLPFKLPLRPYFDVAYVSDLRPISADPPLKDRIWWSGGVCLELGDDIAGVYFPIVNSANLRQLYKEDGRNGYFSQITFQLDLRKLSPTNILSMLSL